MAKVEAPNSAYNGPGPGGATFVEGVADDVDDPGALSYYRGAGYKVSGKTYVETERPEPPDPREVTTQVVGTELRDAAVDPQLGDFLAPINAGVDNPHGSTVVSPEIHASGPAGIRPGEVFVEDIAKQETRETEFAEARLVDQATAGEAVAVEVPDLTERGDLDLSDPGSAEAGRKAAEKVAAAQAAASAPAKADAKAAWVDYAVARGADRDEAEAQTKAELVDTYGG